MKLSVLIPMYNVERYIEECLISLLDQDITMGDYEIIVVNDGSTDNSLEIAKAVAKNHKQIVLHSQENRGAVFTRNKMLKLAKGEYVFFVDADDYVARKTLRTVLDFAISNNLDIAGFDTLVTRSRDEKELDVPRSSIALPKPVSGAQYLRNNRNLRIEIWWYIVKKELIDKHHITFDRTDYDGDVVFTLKLFLEAKKVAHFPIKIYRYFQSSESTIRSAGHKPKPRIINYFMALIDDFSKLIEDLKGKDIPHKNAITNNFKFRRDVFVFFTITKMIKANLGYKEIKRNLETLKAICAYPIKDFNAEEFSVWRYKVLKSMLNNRLAVFFILKTYNSKSKKYIKNVAQYLGVLRQKKTISS